MYGLNIELEAMIIPYGEIKFAVFSIDKAEFSVAQLLNRSIMGYIQSKDEQISPYTLNQGRTSPFFTTFPKQCAQLLPAHVPPTRAIPVPVPSSLAFVWMNNQDWTVTCTNRS